MILCPGLLLAASCSGSSIEDAADGGGGADGGTCSYVWEPPPAKFDAYKSGAESAPSCGVQAWEALPCGACIGDEVCAAGHARDCCGMPPAPGSLTSPLDQWLCSCEGGEWMCWVLFPAASACICSSPDGG
ncbi:hypothetical protein KEG38_52615 [Polyangium jinanense]|uniref:hypothetical protein n=1 Tax=Polyangium jinanense TaxID=2829994 RepID=UPI0023422D70|nr:hypothetical protein [Polyangium jinanense]MDC3962569.1 hypothetical protein [Polyangium jinanense]